jgi:hypothetical protein
MNFMNPSSCMGEAPPAAPGLRDQHPDTWPGRQKGSSAVGPELLVPKGTQQQEDNTARSIAGHLEVLRKRSMAVDL